MGGDAGQPQVGGDGDERDSGQRPVELERDAYFEPGRLNVVPGRDGLPVIAGGEPEGPEPGVSDDNLICLSGPGRPPCEFYVALLRPARGVARGFAPMKEIRRFCTRLQTASELWEIDEEYFACTARRPADPNSTRLIEEFEARQKRAARDASETSGELDF